MMKLNNSFFYIYYRVCKFYSKLTKEDYCSFASIAIMAAIGLLFSSASALILPLLGFQISSSYLTGVSIICIILSLLITDEQKYLELKEHYKNEKYSSAKGWLVTGLIIGSLVCGFIFIRHW